MKINKQEEKRNKKLFLIKQYIKKYMEVFTNKKYHNYTHAKQVAKMAKYLGRCEQVGEENIFLLQTASLLHDIHNTAENKSSYQTKTDEEISGDLAYTITKMVGYTDHQANTVRTLIYATDYNKKPQNLLEKIIRDADVSGFGRKSFFDNSKALCKELGKDYSSWSQKLESLLEKHKWFTKSAEKLFNKQKRINIELAKKYSTND